jgi:hypothetical protein
MPIDPFDQFQAYVTIADQLIGELSKAQVAECARILALHAAIGTLSKSGSQDAECRTYGRSG